MNNIENFIGVYDNVLTPSQCQSMIRYYDELNALNLTIGNKDYHGKGVSAHRREDATAFLMEEDTFFLPITHSTIVDLTKAFWPCYQDYQEKYSVLKETSKHGIRAIRVQKTPVGGGFHQWHYETDDFVGSQRIITWLIYLNDVEEGGETEFLYYHKRIKPKAGRLLIWPAHFTHTHRGNPPLSNAKYIVTSWLNLLE